MAHVGPRAVTPASGPVGRTDPPIGTRSTAAQLKAAGVRAEAPTEHLRREILGRLAVAGTAGRSRDEALGSLFPHTILPPETAEDVVTALVSGAHLLFFGPSGAGKTTLARDVWDLFPKSAWVIPACPVQDHPLSVVDLAVAERFPPCPICRRRFAPKGEIAQFDPGTVDPKNVPAELVNLREGFGYARLQGSSEVFPDHLTGNINLRKLEEIGDPMSPLVLEPGKLLQANRGFLLVDEIGKLPLGTQNVLLQALQEGTVTPAKSRESFPANFVAVCTSNLSDLDNINDPLSDRLTSLHVTYNPKHSDNRKIVWLGRSTEGAGYVPEILVDAGVRVIETWRTKVSDENPDVGEVGSNRTLLDVAARTHAIATLAGRVLPLEEDLKEGLIHAMRGRIRARSGDSFRQNADRVREFIDSHLAEALKRSAGVYWCRYYRGPLRENKVDAEALVSEGRRLAKDEELKNQLADGAAVFGKFLPFTKYVADRERIPGSVRPVDAAVGSFQLLDRHSLFACEGEDADDAALG